MSEKFCFSQNVEIFCLCPLINKQYWRKALRDKDDIFRHFVRTKQNLKLNNKQKVYLLKCCIYQEACDSLHNESWGADPHYC